MRAIGMRGSGGAVLLACALLLAGCGEEARGPVRVSAIGGAPRLINPNLEPLDPPSAFLVEGVAQGLVRFDAAGEIEPALAQSWIVSDDGLRYTFRIRRATWALDGSPVTAQQVAARLRAAFSRASRNPFKPVLGAVESVTPMTDFVLEIALRGPRPNFLQLLAHPELAILQNDGGTGPYRLARAEPAGLRLSYLRTEEESEDSAARIPDLLLRGEGATTAVARFAAGETDLVLGGTAGDLPFARNADLPASRLVFDPVGGLFGLAFASHEGRLADATLRRALSMAIDRDALAAAIGAPRAAGRLSLVAPNVQELPSPAMPDWTTMPLADRQAAAARLIAGLGAGPNAGADAGSATGANPAPNAAAPLHLRVAMPDAPGDTLLFAYLRRDWRAIGVEAERVPAGAPADLLLIDQVAPTNIASWYLRHFTCDASAICDTEADKALDAARAAPNATERQTQLAAADRILTGLVPFIPLTAPVRWSLVSPRLTGFRPNPFARHPAVALIAEEP
jgi:oligopeptide transport system substrate-binding protein